MEFQKTINIKIKDNLTKEQEAIEIAKQLSKNKLFLSQGNKKLIGESVEVQELNTVIKVKRYTRERVHKTLECSRCNCMFASNTSTNVYHNYGGTIKTLKYCSKECANEVLNFLGDRASLYKNKINVPLFF